MIESPYTVHAPPSDVAPRKAPRKPRRAARVLLALIVFGLFVALVWKAQPYWFYRFTGQQRFLSVNAMPVRAIIFSGDGNTLFSGGGEGTNSGEISVWDAASYKMLRSWRGHDRQINALALSPDARVLASGGADGRIKLWDVASGQELKTIAPFDYDFRRVSEITQKIMQAARDPRTGELDRKKLRGDGFTLKQYAPGMDSFYLEPDVPTAIYTEAPDGKRITDAIVAVAFSPDGSHLISTNRNGGAISWFAQSGLADMSAQGTQRFFFGLVSESAKEANNRIDRIDGAKSLQKPPLVWSHTQAQRLATIMFNDETIAAQFSPDGQNLAMLAQSRDNTGAVVATGLAVTTNADTITPNAPGKSSTLWSRAINANAAQRGAVAYSADGKTLGALEGADLVLRDAATGKEMRRLVGWNNRAETPSDDTLAADLALSPDGKSAASCRDGLLSMWKLR